MGNELVAYTSGAVDVPRHDKQVAKAAKRVYDEVRLAGLKAEGSAALAGSIMEGIVALDEHRQTLTNDPIMGAMLMDIEWTAIRKAKAIQTGLFNDWGV